MNGSQLIITEVEFNRTAATHGANHVTHLI